MLRQGFAGQAGLNTTTVGASGRGGKKISDFRFHIGWWVHLEWGRTPGGTRG